MSTKTLRTLETYTVDNLRTYLEALVLPAVSSGDSICLGPLQVLAVDAACREVYFDLDERVMLLDVGAGDCSISLALQEKCEQALVGPGSIKVVPLDLSAKVLSAVNKNAGIAGIVGDCRKLPLRFGTFSGILMVNVLEFIPVCYHGDVVGEVLRVVRPGGFVLVVGRRGDVLEEDFLNVDRSHELGMVFSAVGQTALVKMFLSKGARLEGWRSESIWDLNDSYLAMFRRGSYR